MQKDFLAMHIKLYRPEFRWCVICVDQYNYIPMSILYELYTQFEQTRHYYWQKQTYL